MDVNDIQHGKVVTTIVDVNGQEIIETETFYDGNLAGFKREIERSVLVDRQTVLKQIIEDMGIKSSVITITIHKDKLNEPIRMVTKWNEITDKLGRKQ